MTTATTTVRNVEYIAREIERIDKGSGHWSYLKIGVFEREVNLLETEGTLIGSYERNYGSFYQTFFPFRQGEQWYALYSRDYTSTRMMKLPSCEDIGGEERHQFGFCPVEYFVPQYRGGNTTEKVYAPFGFVAGCVWGDDLSWKIQFLDLRKVSEGILTRDDRMGYITLPYDRNLKDVVDDVYVDDYDEEDCEISFDITSITQYTYPWNQEKKVSEQ